MLSEPISIRTQFHPNHFVAEKKKLIEDHEAEKKKLLEEHRTELEQKEEKIFEARQAAQEAKKKLKSAEGNHSKTKKSLEVTATHVKEMQAEQKAWRKFLEQMDGQLSSKSGFSIGNFLFPSFGVYS